MTSHNPPTGQPYTAWQRYLASEHAARDAYLAVTHHAHLEYLTGPWPDRNAYNAVEVSAWMTYYAAGRAAWQRYTAEVNPPTDPPLPSPPGSGTQPVRPWPTGYEVPGPTQPTYTPNQEGDQ